MKAKILGLLAVGLFCGSVAAVASPVTWNFTGTWTELAGSAQPGFSPLPDPGDAFGISVTFDPTLAPSMGSCDGNAANINLCQAYSGSSLQFVLNSPSCTGSVCTSSAFDSTKSSLNKILVFNDSSNASGDGLTLRLFDTKGNLWRLIFISDRTDIYSGTTLPTSFDPRLLQFQNQFTVCDPNPAQSGCPNGSFRTRATGFQTLAYVPEPGTIALLGFGLAGLGLNRRRRPH